MKKLQPNMQHMNLQMFIR